MPLPLLAIGAGASLLGGILGAVGRNKNRNAGRAEDTRLEQETRRRATAKAALMRGIMQSSGYGNMMTDEQMVNYLTRTERRGTTAGGLTGDIGGIVGGIGHDMMLGAPAGGAGSPQKSAEFWDFLDQALQGRNAAGPARPGGLVGAGTGAIGEGLIPR